MATIAIKNEKAIKRLQDKIDEGINLQNKVVEDITDEEYKVIVDEYDTWQTSCYNVFRQIFSDEVLAIKFMGDQEIIPVNKTHTELIRDLRNDIKTDIKKIQHTVDDLNNNIYTETDEKENKNAKRGLVQTIMVALITAIGGIIAGYLAIPHKTDPLEKQGLENISMGGKFKYICTSFDGLYQHGGRLVIQKQNDGSLMLNGERMWRDTKDTVTGKWMCKIFQESDYLQWHSNWIFVKNSSQINFEYEIPMQTRTVTGYCTGIINADMGKVQSVKGNFYVLNDAPILTGQIIFKRVSEVDFNSIATLPKNHEQQ